MKRSRAYSFINTIKKLRNSMTDEEAINYIGLFPMWEVNKELKVGDRIEYENQLYKVIQSHITQDAWTPKIALSLFEPINIYDSGSKENPITAITGMTYYINKYYLDPIDNNIYKCIRDDTGNGTALYYMPHDLVGAYFSLVS